MPDTIESFAPFLVLPCTIAIFLIGYYLGRARVKHERQRVMKALTTIIENADELSHDVGNHNSELADMEQKVENLDVSGEMGEMQQLLLGHINKVIVSNRKLEDDLTCARYKLETQAHELDRTREEARTDQLSQLSNRKAFDEALSFWVSKHNRKGKTFALALIDIDHFKWINDTHGHKAGDGVVSGVGTLLTKCVRSNDFVARYGGDEFAILLDAPNLETAVAVAERIRSAAETENFSAARQCEQIAITFSMGLTLVHDGDTTESLFKRADSALYEAKKAGRNRLRTKSATKRERPVEMLTAS
jgi:diguanylate cyclase